MERTIDLTPISDDLLTDSDLSRITLLRQIQFDIFLRLTVIPISGSLCVRIGQIFLMKDAGMHFSAIATGIVLLLFCNQPRAFARASQVGHDDPWNPEHVEHLPPEVRNAVVRLCRYPPRAGHYFATYFDNSRVMKLHFEHLHCDGQAMFCRGDICLHQEYVSTGGHYRLMKSYYDRNSD